MVDLSGTGFTQGRIKALLNQPVLRVRRGGGFPTSKVMKEADANSLITARF